MSCSLREEKPDQAESFARAALETGARITFVEDAELLAEADGVGALLRFRLQPAAATK